MTELGFLERKKEFSFSSHYDAAADYLDSPLFIYSVYPWRLKFSFSFLGLGSIEHVFFIEKFVDKFQTLFFLSF
jgi:hypothetical protein